MKDNNTLSSVLAVIGIVVLAGMLLSSGCEKKHSSTESQPTTAEPVTEKVSQEEPVAVQAEQLIEQAQETLVELKKETGVKKNTAELRDVYKKLGEICSKAVETQKNMLEVEYNTPEAEKMFNVDRETLVLKYGDSRAPGKGEPITTDDSVPNIK